MKKKLYQKSYKTALLHLIAHSRAKVKTLSVSNSLVALLDGNNFLDNKILYSKQSWLGFVSKVGDDDEGSKQPSSLSSSFGDLFPCCLRRRDLL